MIGREDAPKPLRVACAVIALQALALVGLAGFSVVDTLTGHSGHASRGLLSAVFALAGAAALLAGARGLLLLSPAARTPVVVLQLLMLPVGYTLAFTAHRPAFGGPVLVAALVVLYLLFTPPVRAVLDRVID